MTRIGRRAGVVIAAALLCAAGARAQTTENEVWPELDGFWTLPSGRFRLYGMAQIARGVETRARTLTLGVHLDDLSPSWGFVRVGYRRLQSLESQGEPEDRLLAEVTVPAT